VGVKASRYLTHIKRLAEPAEPVKRFLERARCLGDKLGPVLVQLPPTLPVDLDRLDATLSEFAPEVRVAVEFRHDSWFTEQTCEVLRHHGAALCLADSPHRKTPRWRTAGWGYVRFHEGRATPAPCYGRQALDTWARQLSEQWTADDDVYAYFNNDPLGCAVRDAAVFAASCTKAGLRPTRVPDLEELTVG